MYLISVIPIAKGIGKETLTYFTSSKVEAGSIVEVPLRKKTVEALVVSVDSARDKRSEIRTSGFFLKKVGKLVSKPFLSEAFMKTVNQTAKYHAATTGATLKVMLPKKLKGLGNIKKIVIAPTKRKDAILPSSLSEIPTNTKTIVIKEYGSNSYKSISRPFIDFRYAIETYAKEIGAKVVKEDFELGSETNKVLEENKKEEGGTFTSIGKYLAEELIGLKKKGSGHIFILGTRKGHSGTVLCQDCGQAMLCPKCNAPITLHMKKGKEEFNNLLCHHCGHKETALTKCKNCGGWRLKAFGLGIERIEEDIRDFAKKNSIDTYIQRLDSTLKLTPKKINEFIDTHYSKPCSILIATEIALPALLSRAPKEKNSISTIPSLDSLLSLPDFGINERIWRMLCQLDNVTENKVIVQTRNPKHQVLVDWKNQDEKGFREREASERKQFGFPPFTVLIKITLKGKKENIAGEMKKIEESLAEWKPTVFPAFIKAMAGQHILHALIKVPAANWPEDRLVVALTSLPPWVTVDVNPRSLL